MTKLKTSQPTDATDATRHAVWSMFFARRLRWGPTWRGWIVLLVIVGVGSASLMRFICPFLAITAPVGGDILVIEGWIPNYAVAEAAALIKQDRYTRVITVGGPVAGVRSPAATDDTRAYVAAKALAQNGVDRSRIDLVPTHSISRDRTYHSALTLRHWLEAHDLRHLKVDVVTLGMHARRTRLLFAEALGEEVEVGIISIQNEEYDPDAWWHYSEGIKEMISELAGYLYAKFIFRA